MTLATHGFVNFSAELSPMEAFQSMDFVYNLKDKVNIGVVTRDFHEINKHFDFGESACRLVSMTGAFALKKQSGFSALAMGRGKFQGHALITFRGTSTGLDWITDGNTGVQQSRCGHLVHAGFNRVFNQMEEDIVRWVQVNKPSVVHCTGHSLGGALANLAASRLLALNNGPQVRLYTIGSPRVGDATFARNLSTHNKLGQANIHRVYHSSDPVPQLPLWPFVHAPQPGGECYISDILWWNFFKHTRAAYLKSLANAESWKSLRNPHPNIGDLWPQWLQSPNSIAVNGGLNFYNLEMLTRAINTVIRKSLFSAWSASGLCVIAGASVLDHLSYLLTEAMNTSEENKTLVSLILQKMLQMCGIKPQKDISITQQFIFYVLDKLTRALYSVASIAIRRSF